MTDPSESGPGRRSSDRTKAAILRAAREHFAARGYERTTIRGVAADAGIDPSMVMRYFGTKERLFDAALAVDLRLPDLAAVPPHELPAVLVGHFVDRWEGDPADDALLVLLRSAVTNEQAAERMRRTFAEQVLPALAAALGPERAARCAGLIASQVLGLALTRYLLRLPPVVSLDRAALVAAYAPAVAAVLA
ncbi:TetR/AcrR family transcriptional regulator [Streptomyces antimicrobicus]|uniref:TetR family transcriptional regulator n=1 Tax=Streptomyces antimicrobicus TaxID=2883108 RepID=A0ABS8B3B4_9ACTN|nr:TetR family transcriptional regulator [Streptomyces antimicrobicus]MCB5179079.1 TetR family transcriptional regulator [Streptomyces antimicrobicus]